MILKDIPPQCTNVCTSCPNPVPDAAAFISSSDLSCFETSSPHLLISRHSKQNQSYWTHPHVPALFGTPPPLRFKGDLKSFYTCTELLQFDWWRQIKTQNMWDHNKMITAFSDFVCPDPKLCFISFEAMFPCHMWVMRSWSGGCWSRDTSKAYSAGGPTAPWLTVIMTDKLRLGHSSHLYTYH